MSDIKFNEAACRDLSISAHREWLDTNGLGGFCSGTVSGMHTRRYHGLLVWPQRPPVGRMVLLSKVEESILWANSRIDLGCNQYLNAVFPEGFKRLREFRLNPFPTWIYEFGGIRLSKTVYCVHGEHTVAVHYKIIKRPGSAPPPVRLEVRPLIAFREFHSLTRENLSMDGNVHVQEGLASVTPYEGLPTLYFAHNAKAGLDNYGYWYHDFQYPEELSRGLDAREDLFSPFSLTYDLSDPEGAVMLASTEPHNADDYPHYKQQELDRRKEVLELSPSPDAFLTSLTTASDAFIVKRGSHKSIIAGYHWFGDWSRDTMIALPGLTLVSGRYDIARSILKEYVRHLDQGMLPNRFPDDDEVPEYNNVDGTLWYFNAIRKFLEYTDDEEFVQKEIYPALVEIVDWHIKGTRYNIKATADGLLYAGQPGVQLTWMDAKVGDWVVTPRMGFPVEIQALWYNALMTLSDLSVRFGDTRQAQKTHKLAEALKQKFVEQFWFEEGGYLKDVVNLDGYDASLRPNQVIALSLPFTMVDKAKAKSVLDVVERHLLTPYGLRTLSAGDTRFVGRYEGGILSRDAAYHQGTVWAWLLGPFITAYVRFNDGRKFARQKAAGMLEPFRRHLTVSGLGHISEVFDGDQPHNPGGCIAQAWSTAEILRCAYEDVYQLGGKG